MALNKECPVCKAKMEEKETRIVAGTKYIVLKCEKCHYNVARSAD